MLPTHLETSQPGALEESPVGSFLLSRVCPVQNAWQGQQEDSLPVAPVLSLLGCVCKPRGKRGPVVGQMEMTCSSSASGQLGAANSGRPLQSTGYKMTTEDYKKL